MPFFEEEITFSKAVEALTKAQIKTLKSGVMKLNNVEGNETKIKVVARKVKDIVTDLTTVVETLSQAEIDMPDEPVEFFNEFWPNVISDPETKKPAGKPAANKKDKPPATKKEPKTPKAQLRATFLHKFIKKKAQTKKDITDALHNDFGDSESEARYQSALALNYLTAFGAVEEKNGKFKIA